ncbi:unnamed protein product, partial [Larinioides sclopetarius]
MPGMIPVYYLMNIKLTSASFAKMDNKIYSYRAPPEIFKKLKVKDIHNFAWQ